MAQKILLLDDSAFMRLILKGILARAGYTDITEATSPGEMIELYKSENPDLLLLDIIMPTMSGLDALKHVMETGSKAKVLMITAVGQDEIINECVQVGANGYITKPFDKKRVINEVKRAIGSARKPKIIKLITKRR